MKKHIVNKLYDVLQKRKEADPKESYVASLYKKGPNKMAKKIGEEGVEVSIEVVRKKPNKIREESADLLFHMMVMWSYFDIKPDEVFEILEGRFGMSGHEEKANRDKDD